MPKQIVAKSGPKLSAGRTCTTRRSLLLGGVGLLAAGAPPFWPTSRALSNISTSMQPALDPFIADIQERTFRFFWDTTNPKNGLARDRFPSPSPSSIAAVGFALTAYPIGVERGYITRSAARERVLATLRFFHDAPQGPNRRGTAGHNGFFYHFLDMETGLRSGQSELSTVDTALFLAGALFCQSYFDAADADEAQIRALADRIYRRVDWRWAQVRAPAIGHGWLPECGFLPYDWLGYNEAMIVYLLALGSPTYPVEQSAWDAWTSTYDQSWLSEFRRNPSRLCAAVRSPVLPDVDRSARPARRLHEPTRHRLLREQQARDLCAAGLCHRQSAGMEGLWRRRLGTDRFRWAGRHRARV